MPGAGWPRGDSVPWAKNALKSVSTPSVPLSAPSSTVGAEVAFGSAAVSFSGISADGTRLRSMTNRLTMGLEKTAGVWKITHEHSSLPIDMATGKGIFTPGAA